MWCSWRHQFRYLGCSVRKGKQFWSNRTVGFRESWQGKRGLTYYLCDVKVLCFVSVFSMYTVSQKKRNPFLFIRNFFNTQYNLTEFGFLIHKWIVISAMWFIFELYTTLRTLPRKKFAVNITSLIMVYRTVLLCITHKRLLICRQMRRQIISS